MLTMLLEDKLYLAPINEDCRTVLDVGCGTGLWAIDFADAHPSCEVHGIDLSPIQPAWVPPNCQFAIDDVEEEWTFPPNHFDFVHIRCLMGSISKWSTLYRQAYHHLVPGGWIQHLEMSIEFTSDDGTVGPDHIMAQWSKTFIEAGEIMGKTFRIADNSSRWMQEAGFEDVHEKWYKVPVGRWTRDKVKYTAGAWDARSDKCTMQTLKQIGFWNYHYCLQGCEGWALYLLTKVLGWSVEQVQVFIAAFRNALNDRRNHAYYKM